MRIREFLNSDAIELLQLFNDSIHLVSSKDYSLAQVNAWAPKARSLAEWETSFNNKTVYVVETSSGLAGFAEIEDNGHIDRFYTSAQHQGLGVGKMLLAQIEEYAKSQSLKRLFVEASITAKPFFSKRGFELLEQQTVTLRGVEFTNFRMEKYL